MSSKPKNTVLILFQWWHHITTIRTNFKDKKCLPNMQTMPAQVYVTAGTKNMSNRLLAIITAHAFWWNSQAHWTDELQLHPSPKLLTSTFPDGGWNQTKLNACPSEESGRRNPFPCTTTPSPQTYHDWSVLFGTLWLFCWLHQSRLHPLQIQTCCQHRLSTDWWHQVIWYCIGMDLPLTGEGRVPM